MAREENDGGREGGKRQDLMYLYDLDYSSFIQGYHESEEVSKRARRRMKDLCDSMLQERL